MIKSRRIRWGKQEKMRIGFWWKSRKERDHWEDLFVDLESNIKMDIR
jgi:hypothetical protein